ncbi:MAG: metallophosphoesterase family protein [Planctomycetota bacterium]|nr:metallophosphatase family protein [Planctomycetota bacterium]MCX8039316.1 metallophosphatase family protein [Planctomycetota bacterium]MDW8372081.1 metallophosphoesterase family protein [Planctomycetota bacterium]
MRYAFLGDIHGNYPALMKVLEAIKDSRIDRIVCLGDIVGYGAEPVRCLEAIRELGCDCIAGNHDWAAIGRISIDAFNAYAKVAALWTREQLSDDHKAWLAALPLTLMYEHCAVAHGTFHQPEAFNYIQTVFDAEQSFAALRARGVNLGFLGHSHVPVTFFDSDPITYTLESVVPVDAATTTIVNAGSVGQPRDENNRACWVMYDSNLEVVEIHRVAYDIDEAARQIRAAGLPEILALRLYQGK